MAIMSAWQSYAASGTWNSTAAGSNAYWTNSLNWSASPYPAGDQTATFNNSGQGRTTLDVEGLKLGCKDIFFDTANAAAYTVGSGGANAQSLIFTNNSIVRVASTVNSNQTVNALTLLGLDRAASSHNYRNDKGSVTLNLAGNITATNSGGTAAAKTLITLGTGPITISGNISPGGSSGINLTNNTLGLVTFTGSNRLANVFSVNGAMTFNGTNHVSMIYLNTDRVLTFTGTNVVERIDFNGHPAFPATVTITANSCLALTNGGGQMLGAYQDTVINGPGYIAMLPCHINNGTGDNLVAAGKTLTINADMVGPNGFEIWTNLGTAGTYAFNGANSFAYLTVGPLCTVSFNTVGNAGSTNSSLGKGAVTVGASGTRLLYTGAGETANRSFTLNTSCIIEHGGSGYLNLSGSPTFGGGGKTITLQGSTTADAEFSAVISNTSGANSIAKSGSGKWLLTANNTYAGTTTVNAGTLALSGANGAVNASTGYTLAGGTLLLDNTAAANNTNRLRDASAITLNGGTLRFSNTGGAVNYIENAGAVTANAGNSTIATVQAAVGQTATLRFASLAHTAGAVNFTGTGLGQNARNRIFITGQADGLIGPWATVDGARLAAYSSVNGVYAAAETAYTDIAARGPSTLVSNSASTVRINTAGTSGPIELDSDVTRVASILQNTATAAEINTASKALQTAGLVIPTGRASVTVGQAPNDGTLAPLQSGGTLDLHNNSANGLTVNAVVADNGSASKLSKFGTGAATLTAANTFSGVTAVGNGTLVLANSDALQNSTLTTAGSVFDSSVASHAFTLGNMSGNFTLNLADNDAAPNAVALTVGKNNANATYSGSLTGNGSLIKTGSGVLTLNSANTFGGGLTVQDGTVLVTNNANALGLGPVVNHATLNLNAGAVLYSGLSVALSGSGTNNVILGTGSTYTDLNGDYSGFTGVWNVGTNAVAGSSRVRMRGLDNAAATLNILSNGTLWVDAAGTHNAALVLYGGETGETHGQFRIDNGAVWAGPVTLAGDITTANDSILGAESGVGTITGVISDRDGIPHPVRKGGTQTLVLLNTNNTYQGQTWVASGTLRTPAIKNVGAASPLGGPTTSANGAIKIGMGNTSATLTYFGMGDTTDRILDLAGTNNTATLDMSGTNLLKFVGGFTNSVPGNRTLGLQGSTIGTGELAVTISDYSASFSNMMTKVGSGTWVLSGANTFRGGIKFNNSSGGNCGTLVAAHPTALGSGSLQFVNSLSTVEFAHDGVGEIPPDVYMNVSAFGTLKSGVAAGDSVGINHAIGRLTISAATALVTRAESVTSGQPSITATSLDLFSGGTGTTHLFPTNATFVVLGGVGALSGSGTKTLNLDGTTEGNAIYGGISNGVNTVGLTKSNISTWTLHGSNIYTAATAINRGLLVLAGADGKIIGTSGITLSGNGTLELRNHELTNSTDRLRDTAALTLNGGKLLFSHAGGAAHFTEAVGALSVAANSNVVATSQADVGYTSVVSFASLTHTGSGLLDFQGAGLGDADQRNQVLITNQVAGLIGLWATHNATNFAAYDTTLGVIAADDTVFTDIPNEGPYEIASSTTLNARIASEGSDQPLALAGLPTSSLKSLLQNWGVASTIGMTNQTLQVSDIMIASGKEALTLGTQENEGLVMAASAGGGLALINQSASTLTLNAAVTNNTSASSLAKYGSGLVKLTGRNSYTGPTLIDEGTLEVSANVPQRLSGVISGAGTLTKSGTNQLQILGANTYTGPTLINQGIVRPDQNNTFGLATAGTVTIASGATLDLGCDSSVGGTRGADALNMGTKQFVVSGHGVNGAGAIVCNGGQNQANAINRVSLAGDTTFGGGRRWDLRSNTPYLNLNDNTLFKTGANEFCVITTTVNPGAGHIVVNQGLFRFETTSAINGTAANTVTVNSGAILEMYNLLPSVPQWTAIVNEHAQFRGAGTLFSTNYNVWGGPITLNGKAYFNGNQGGINFTVTGDISGTGTLVKAGQNTSTLYLTGNSNTYSGGTIVSNGVIFARSTGSLPGYNSIGKVIVAGVNGSALSIRSSDGVAGWTAAQIKDLHDNAVFVTNTSVLVLDTAPSSVDWSGDLTQPMTLTKNGNNTLTLSGTTSFNGPMNLNNGLVLMNGAGNHRVGNVTISNATLIVTNALATHVYATNTIIGNAAADFGRMTLAGNAAWGTVLPIVNTATPYMIVGNSGRGVLVLQDNAMITNRFIVGSNNGGHGAVYQRDNSTFHNWGGQSTDSRIGASGYGYYELSSGTMTNNGYFQLGVGLTGVGILHQSGGFFRQANKYNGQLGISRGGTGVVYVTGGKFDSFISMNVGEESENSAWRGFAEFTVDGAGDATVAGNLTLAHRTNMFAVVNLNGGRLTANQFAKGTRGVGSVANLTFDGGTWRARAAGNLFGTGASALDKVLVYAGGATFDTTNLNVTANANLLAPPSSGVASISITPRGGYIGPPMVTINGGGGTGATAIVNFDSANGTVSGVTMTSPGYGYTSLPTVTLSGGGTNLQTTVTGVTLAPNISGGLTKSGNGTLTLTGTNTYGGATTLIAGTLKLNTALALPANTTVTFSGGTLDLNGLTFSNLVNTTGALTGGITNGILRSIISPAGDYWIGSQTYSLNIRSSGLLQASYHADVAPDGTCDVLAVQGNIDLSNFALEIVDLGGLDRHKQYTILTCTGVRSGTFAYTNITDARWKLFYLPDGSVKLAFFDGTMIKIK